MFLIKFKLYFVIIFSLGQSLATNLVATLGFNFF